MRQKRLAAAALLAALAGCLGCRSVPVENGLGVAVSAESLARLEAAAQRSDFPIKRISFRVCFHPGDQAVAVVDYADTDLGDRVIRREGWFTNSNWPSRSATGLATASYPASLGPPSADWKPHHDQLFETVWHRFTVGGQRLEVFLGKGVSRALAQELLGEVHRAEKANHPYMRGQRLAEARCVEQWAHDDPDHWVVWFGSSGLSSSGIYFRRENGRPVIDGIAHGVS